MRQTGHPFSRSIFNWLGAGALIFIAVGLIYLTMRDRPAAEPTPPPSLLSPLVTLDSPVSLETPPAAASLLPTASPTALPPAPPIESTGFQLTVLHTNDTWGYLFPCG